MSFEEVINMSKWRDKGDSRNINKSVQESVQKESILI